ncbi:hypothetical protein B0H13DRAFT_2327968 [Mycena leptocephala]|nr:hypothetical protein B0H13DRAFT_2327968 [Mycena leptocephala]
MALACVLCELAGKPIANPLPIKTRRKLDERLLCDLQQREAKRAGPGTLVSRLPLDEDDIALLFADVHRGCSALPPHAVPVKAMLAADAERHERVDGGLWIWGEEVKAVVGRHAKELGRNREWVM